MSSVRTNGTDIEELLVDIVKPLWRKYRYRKNPRKILGKPDIYFPCKNLVVFADGDFWHGKGFDKWGIDVAEFWQVKIGKNIERDKRQAKELKKMGYKVIRFWGSEIKKKPDKVYKKIKNLLKVDEE